MLFRRGFSGRAQTASLQLVNHLNSHKSRESDTDAVFVNMLIWIWKHRKKVSHATLFKAIETTVGGFQCVCITQLDYLYCWMSRIILLLHAAYSYCFSRVFSSGEIIIQIHDSVETLRNWFIPRFWIWGILKCGVHSVVSLNSACQNSCWPLTLQDTTMFLKYYYNVTFVMQSPLHPAKHNTFVTLIWEKKNLKNLSFQEWVTVLEWKHHLTLTGERSDF